MQDRLKTLRRIEALCSADYELARWRLSRLRAECDVLRESRGQALRASGADSAFFGPFARAMSKRIFAIEASVARAEAECRSQERRALEQGARATTARKAAAKANGEARLMRRRQELLELIELALTTDGTSLA